MERLNKCAESGHVKALYSIIAGDPYVLENIDRIPFTDTPLHVAAAAGKTHFAMEMMNLKPSFARKLNYQGLSPIHLALQNSRDDLVRSIVTIDSELVRVKSKGMVTPLHFIGKKVKFQLLAEFLCLCPSSIEDLTVKCETAVHIAVKKGNWESLKVLLGWLRRSNKEEILKWKDDDDNTVLHIAVATNQTEVVELLIPYVKVNAKNLEGKTAMDIFNAQGNSLDRKIGRVIRCAGAKKATDLSSTATLRDPLTFIERKHKYLRNFGNSPDRSANDIRNIVLVAATLIATVAYQAVLSPPAGYWQENSQPTNKITNIYNITNINNTTATIDEGQGQETSNQPGKMILGYISSFRLFYFSILNSLAFYVSVCTILLIIVGLPYFHILAVATNFLPMTYAAAVTATWPSDDGDWYPWLSSAFGYSIFLVSFLAVVIPLGLSYKLDRDNKYRTDDIPRR